MATKPENYQPQANMTYYDAGKVCNHGSTNQKHKKATVGGLIPDNFERPK